MEPFLYLIARKYYQEYNGDLSEIAFIFPNRRAGIFFQKYLAEVAGKPIFSPDIFTINDFFQKLSPYRPADRISMLFILYKEYGKLGHSDESFDDFVFWGDMLLNDFDDVDKYVADARQLFRNIKELKEIDESFDYLTKNQIDAIKQFWSNFNPINESKKKIEFLSIWEILFSLYSNFKERLKEKKLAYEGMIFRDVAEKAMAGNLPDTGYKKIVFIGLNVLSRSEEIVMKKLKDRGIADFYWDDASPYVKDKHNKASYFLSKNRILFPSELEIDITGETGHRQHIETIGIPSAVGQAKQAGEIIENLIRENKIPDVKKAINTAIVLPDEHLLLPVLYSVPGEIDPLNVTMGYTLSNTPVAGLIESIFDLQKHLKMQKGNAAFYHRNVLSLLSHRYIMLSGEKDIFALSNDIRRYNKVFIDAKELEINDLLKKIFVPIYDIRQAAEYLLDILEYMQMNTDPDEKSEASDYTSLSPLEKEFLYHYYITINRLKEVITEYDIPMNVPTFFRLVTKMTGNISIPFRGEPLSGLQIMGVLETRALDFENLIVLSVNEGIFPIRKTANTFIPYNLRKGFGLSTTEHQDSIYAYYFYRMIYRAKNIFLLYDTRTEGTETGEMSRYLYQLKYHYRLPIKEKLITYNISVNDAAPLVVTKTGPIMEKLQRFLEGGDKALSASAINIYINCPLQFYLKSVERIQPDDDVSENIEASTFGSIYHKVMEYIYQRLQGQLVTADILEKIQKDEKSLTRFIETAFAECYYQKKEPSALTGQNFLAGEIIRKYVKKTLTADRKLTPFRYIESERLIEMEHDFGGTKKVRLKAFIDRIDEKDGTVRIIDYKSGIRPGSGANREITFKSIDELFDPEIKNRPKAVMQVFMYAMMYSRLQPGYRIEPGIYYLRSLFENKFNWLIYYKPERISEAVHDFAPFDKEFVSSFNKCLNRIFDQEIPFTQTPHTEICEYCEFASICKR
ncbi:PD-(D/E)XK nuclease family protein [Coprobacter tertius]|uniref:PD-(D/E)XK nuclease family protein n=1 Tax=Coprobacter tertius TaxID=2944915 RepID=A0ABT1MJB2_9BACT|nr:PD-(D/E)XK nuclease family protein [Coprobacter tertius]MCP9611783.1 PD-(D/E)XK nuclease family protein [Coprobacter tertius]